MKILRVYLDTSVLGGCFDPEFAMWSRGLMADFRMGTFQPILSDLLESELRSAPESVKALHAELRSLEPASVPVTSEALDLLGSYQVRGVLAPKFRNDMLHIALATVADADVLVSWNFRHIVRLDKIRLFNAANIEAGYKPLAIHSPREVTTYGRDQNP